MKKVTIVRPDGSKLILEGATPEEILKLSPVPAVYYAYPVYPTAPYWWGWITNPAPAWIGNNKTIIGNNGCIAGAATYTLTTTGASG